MKQFWIFDFGFWIRGIRAFVRINYLCTWPANRRKNRLTETTRTRWRRAILIRSRSRLRSSSLVTKYLALPRMAASTIASSSGSRQILNSPDVCMTAARLAISLTKFSVSRCGYLNCRINRGRLRTSASSESCDKDVTTLYLSLSQLATTCPGGPVGFKNAETHTLVSSKTTSGTALRLDLGPGSTDFGLDISLWDCFGARPHSPQKTLKVSSPLRVRTQSNRDVRLFPQPERLQRSKNAVFIDRLKSLFRGHFSFEQCHNKDYSDAPTLRSIAMEATR